MAAIILIERSLYFVQSTYAQASADDRAVDTPLRIRAALLDTLQSVRAKLSDEIRCYPSPIPACDQHFNFMLEQRGMITDEIARLLAIPATASPQGILRVLETSLNGNSYLDDGLRNALRERVRKCGR